MDLLKRHIASLVLTIGLVLGLGISILGYEAPTLEKYAGIYADSSGKKYILNPRKGFPHFVLMNTGETHMLRKIGPTRYEFSSTRNSWDRIGGHIEVSEKEGERILCLTYVGKPKRCANSVPWDKRAVSLSLENKAEISGDLITPAASPSDLIAVLLHGDGENDRYDIYDIGMYLVDGGVSVFAFDKRNAGNSKGPKVTGDSYDQVSRAFADDATRVVKKLIKKYPKKRIGVVGLSQGGWIGSIVSANTPELAFYVNIAGNTSLGWKQWQHYMISYLKRNGFDKEAIAEAEDYFRTFFAVGLGRTSFRHYLQVLEKYKQRDWLESLRKRRLVVWKDKETAVRVIKRNSNDPAIDVRLVSAPTLGIFFQYDHSTPPDSPARFLKSLEESRSQKFTVKTFPNANHGGWYVKSYYFDSSKIRRLKSEAFYYLGNWLRTI